MKYALISMHSTSTMSATVGSLNQEDAKRREYRLQTRPHSSTDAIFQSLGSGCVRVKECDVRRGPATSRTGVATMPAMSALAPTALLDRKCVDELRFIERAAGRDDFLSGFIRALEHNLADFSAAFCDCIARGDAVGATRAAHTLKGAC